MKLQTCCLSGNILFFFVDYFQHTTQVNYKYTYVSDIYTTHKNK